SSGGELFLDLVHERRCQARLAQIGEIAKRVRFPRFFAANLLYAPILQVDGPRLVDASKKHQRVGAVAMDPDLVWSEGDGLVGGFKTLGKVGRDYELICDPADPTDGDFKTLLPWPVVAIGRHQALIDGKHLPIVIERLIQLAGIPEHVGDAKQAESQV